MGCSQPATITVTAPLWIAPVPSPVTQNGLTLTFSSQTAASLSWSPVAGATSYLVGINIQTGSDTQQTVLGSPVAVTIPSGVDADFYVTACGAAGCNVEIGSLFYNGAPVQTQPCNASAPLVPGPLVPYLISATSDSITIGWGAYTSKEYRVTYYVQVSGPGYGTGGPSGNTGTDMTYTIQGYGGPPMQANAPYSVQITAVFWTGNGTNGGVTGPMVIFCTTT